ncbi:MAG: alginate export family protein [Bacteroidota bacterium]|nr:alginate export family protein [Bacteroidota bacterium]
MTKKLKKRSHSFLVMLLFLSGCLSAKAQLSLSGQLRTRTEYRDGLGTLPSKTSDPAFFTSQRTRLIFHYKSSRLIFHTSVQDIRVWGQDASTISNNDGNRLSVHEAWAELVLANKSDSSFRKPGVDYFGVKIGRQELLYDDSRLLGNLDWLQQARRHDAIVFKLLNKGWQFDLGAAFNQNTDAFNYNGTYYTPANVSPYVKDSKGNLAPTPSGLIPLTNPSGWSIKSGVPALQAAPSTNGLYQDYKALQFLYVARTFHAIHVTGLMLADHFGKYSTDSIRNISGTDTGYIYGRHFNQHGVNSRVTAGILLNSFLNKQKSLSFIAGYYYQTGKDRDGLSLDAFTTTLSVSFAQKLFSYTAGWDYVSGNDAFSSSKTNHRFDPLYGTPHKFWGYMDYFYVGTGSPVGGLSNPYFKIKYGSINKRWVAGIDYHYFGLAQDQKDLNGNPIKKYLGSEADLVTNYSLSKVAGLEWGFCVMAASGSMEYAKGLAPGSSKLTGVWTYLMLTLKPEFFSKEK